MLSPSEQTTLVTLLSKLSPGFLPKEIFYQMCRLNALTAFEIIPLRTKNKRVEVLLIQRPNDDPFWGGQWHTPGSIILSTDRPHSLDEVQQRVLKELHYPENKESDVIFTNTEFLHWKRGTGLSMYHYMELEESYGVGTFFPVDELPENIVEHQGEVIGKVVEIYARAQSMSDSVSI